MAEKQNNPKVITSTGNSAENNQKQQGAEEKDVCYEGMKIGGPVGLAAAVAVAGTGGAALPVFGLMGAVSGCFVGEAINILKDRESANIPSPITPKSPAVKNSEPKR